MKWLLIAAALAALAACSQEVATTAATSASIKQREVEEGKKTMEQAREKIGQSMDATRERAEKDADK